MLTVVLTILAYVLALLFPHWVMTFVVLPVGWLVALVLYPLPIKVRSPIAAFIAGVVGGFAAVGFGFLVFRWLVGADSFGFLPFLVTATSIVYSIWKDYVNALEMRQPSDEMKAAKGLGELGAFATSGTRSLPRGELFGLFVGLLVFV